MPTSNQLPEQGNLASLTDATDSTTPTASVIFPTNLVSLSWDFGGDAEAAAQRRLDTVSIWVTADSERQGFNGWLATSLDGVNYTEIPGSRHNDRFLGVGVHSDFHHLLYDFTGTNVSNFRFLRLNTEGYSFELDGPFFQPLFTEIDVTTSPIPEPSTVVLLAAGAGFLGLSAVRRNRKNVE